MKQTKCGIFFPQCFNTNDLRVKRLVLELLAAVCLLGNGHSQVLEGVSLAEMILT
jgi:hypothetical protein